MNVQSACTLNTQYKQYYHTEAMKRSGDDATLDFSLFASCCISLHFPISAYGNKPKMLVTGKGYDISASTNTLVNKMAK
jgi:hypothetical protein